MQSINLRHWVGPKQEVGQMNEDERTKFPIDYAPRFYSTDLDWQDSTRKDEVKDQPTGE